MIAIRTLVSRAPPSVEAQSHRTEKPAGILSRGLCDLYDDGTLRLICPTRQV